MKRELNEQRKEMQARIDAKDAKLEELAGEGCRTIVVVNCQ